jgi:CubicO group peptidase (beta-lactamase class C family)
LLVTIHLLQIDRLQKRIPELMTQAGVPGLSVALIGEAQVMWAEGFGVTDTHTPQPVTAETIFEGASLSKPPFAYAALKLHEEGVLDLDAPLTAYLPTTEIEPDPRQTLITKRRVLCHTCGLPNWRPDGEPLRLRLTPGERFSYSGEGYMLLQRVVEQLTGQTGEAFMQSRLLQPLGMANSSYLWSGDEKLPLAIGHDREGQPMAKRLHNEMWAAASLHTTPTAFARFMAAMMQPQAESGRHLSGDLLDAILAPQVQVNDSAPWQDDWPKERIALDSQVSWGLGWGLQQDAARHAFWHWGDNFNYTAFALGIRQEGSGVVIMTNSNRGYDLFEPLCQEALGGEYPAIWWLKSLIG